MNLTRDHGDNLEVSIEGDQLTIKIDLSKSIGLSKSGKSRLIASTGGNRPLPDGSRLGVNVYRSVQS